MGRCITYPMPGGGYAIVRFTGERAPKPCVVCGGIGTKLCDYPRKPKPSRARCNASMCDAHAVHVGPDLDWCHPCAEADMVAGAGSLRTPPAPALQFGGPDVARNPGDGAEHHSSAVDE